MKYIDEFRNKELAVKLLKLIHKASKKEIRLMEVCGGHTMAINKYGIPSLLPQNISLISGPGCPVCVSGKKFIDQSIIYSQQDENIIATLGDLMRVPGSQSSLEKEKANGADIRLVHSALQSLQIAKENPEKKVIFLGIGFETTAPATAVTFKKAFEEKLTNIFLFSAHKIMPPAMETLIDEGVKINGYICPGHVSVITGSGIYQKIASGFGLGCVVSGFEPLDILQSILMLVRQFEENTAKVEIQYTRAVKPEGNQKAKQWMDEVFELRDDWWRGLGQIPLSGLRLKDKFASFDIERINPMQLPEPDEPKGCICGEILKGIKKPVDCKLFGNACKPESPVGACMVSGEGTCQAYYKYNKDKNDR